MNPTTAQRELLELHEFDDDCVCVHCGFDGAEWSHWKRKTYEGLASEARAPACTRAAIAKGERA